MPTSFLLDQLDREVNRYAVDRLKLALTDFRWLSGGYHNGGSQFQFKITATNEGPLGLTLVKLRISSADPVRIGLALDEGGTLAGEVVFTLRTLGAHANDHHWLWGRLSAPLSDNHFSLCSCAIESWSSSLDSLFHGEGMPALHRFEV